MSLNILHILIGELKNDTRVLSEINLLAGMGHSITAMCYKQSDVQCDARYLLSIGRKHTGKFKTLFALLALVRAYVGGVSHCLFRQQVRIVHCHDIFGLLIGALIKITIFWRNLKVIYDSHELAWDTYHLKGRPIRRLVFIRLESLLIKSADKVIVVTPKIAELYQRRYNLKTSPHTYYNLFHDIKIIEKKSRTIKKLVYVGGLVKGKGLEKLLDLPSGIIEMLDLTVIGDGPLKQNFLKLSEKHPNIKVEGYIKPSAIINRLVEFDFGILPLVDTEFGQSKFLALPNKLFEYASAGLGLISWKGEAQAEIVRQYKLGFYPKQCEEFTEYIHRIVNSNNFGLIDYTEFRRFYSFEKNQARLLNVYMGYIHGK